MIPALKPSFSTVILSALAGLVLVIVLVINIVIGENRSIYD